MGVWNTINPVLVGLLAFVVLTLVLGSLGALGSVEIAIIAGASVVNAVVVARKGRASADS